MSIMYQERTPETAVNIQALPLNQTAIIISFRLATLFEIVERGTKLLSFWELSIRQIQAESSSKYKKKKLIPFVLTIINVLSIGYHVHVNAFNPYL